MARSVLEQLIVELSTDNTKLTQGLRQAEQQTQTSAQRLGASARAIGIATAAVAGAVAAVGTAYIAAANRAADYADEVDKAALRTRLSRQSVQELRFVTDQLGGSFATVETAVRGLTQRLAGAEQGSERQTEAFARLGIATRDANGSLRSSEELLFDSISALQGVTNETERAVLAQEVFGRSAAELGPILSAGAGSVDELRQRARDLGLVLDDQSVGSLVAYKDQLSAVQQQFGALQREVVLEFLPVLTNDLLPFVENSLIPAFRGLASFLTDTVAPAVRGIATGFGELKTSFEAFVTSFESNGSRLEATVGVLRAIQRGLGLDPGQFDNSVFFPDLSSGGRRDGLGADARFVSNGPDLANLGAAFGPQLPPGGLPGSAGAPGSSAGAGGGGGATAAAAAVRTVGNVFAELAAGGTAANRYAQALGATPEALLQAAQQRRGLLQGALRELVTNFYDVVDEAQLAYLAQRITEVESEIASLTAGRIPASGAFATVAGAVRIPGITPGVSTGTPIGVVPNVTARVTGVPDGASRAQFPTGLAANLALRDELARQAVQADRAAAELESANRTLGVFTSSLEALSRLGREQARENAAFASVLANPFAGAPGGNPGRDFQAGRRAFTPGLVSIPVPDVAAIEQTTNERVKLELDAARERARIDAEAAQDFKNQVVLSSVQFGANLVDAIRSGSPSGIFGAAAGGASSLISLFNPLAGGIFGIVGSLFAGLLPDGRAGDAVASRAAGAAARGAPAIELNFTNNQSISVQSLTGEGRLAVDALAVDAIRRFEQALASVTTRLSAVEARTA